MLVIESLVTDTPLQDVITTWSGETRYGELKKKVASSVSVMLEDFQARLAQVDDNTVYRFMKAGEQYANEVANAKLLEVQKVVGLR